MNAISRTSFRSSPLTEDQLRQSAPSVFALEAHGSRSERFAPIPTIEVVRRLEREGFHPYAAKQTRTRDVTRQDFTKHMIRFRHEGVTSLAVGDTFLETVLVNANDGSASYKLMAGLFRIRCLNGMIASQGTVEEIRVGHRGDVIGKVIEGSYRVLEQGKKAIEAPEEWAQIKLEREEQLALARAARALRFADSDGEIKTPIQAEDMLKVRRTDDQGNDLWRTFNVIQENTIKGGLHGIAIDPETRRRRNVTTRPVNGIDQDVKLNRALWEITQHFASLKRAA